MRRVVRGADFLPRADCHTGSSPVHRAAGRARAVVSQTPSGEPVRAAIPGPSGPRRGAQLAGVQLPPREGGRTSSRPSPQPCGCSSRSAPEAAQAHGVHSPRCPALGLHPVTAQAEGTRTSSRTHTTVPGKAGVPPAPRGARGGVSVRCRARPAAGGTPPWGGSRKERGAGEPGESEKARHPQRLPGSEAGRLAGTGFSGVRGPGWPGVFTGQTSPAGTEARAFTGYHHTSGKEHQQPAARAAGNGARYVATPGNWEWCPLCCHQDLGVDSVLSKCVRQF